MNPWSTWTWPWVTTMGMYQRALESIAFGLEAAGADDHRPTGRDQPEWTTPNHEIIDLTALRLRDFSFGKSSHRPVVVVAPFALHDAGIADLAPGHSLVQALRANGCPRLFLAEWKSATPETRLHTIDTQLAALNVAIDDIGSPLDLIGLCQGGWLSLVYAARFPKKVRRLVLAGAPVDLRAEPSLLSAPTNPVTDALIDEFLRLGDGLVLGRHLAALWPRELDKTSSAIESLQLGGPPATETERRTAATFERWHRRALDLPGPYYRQVFDWLYRENRLAAGTFPALGRRIDLRNLHCPLFLLAGARDVIAPPAQVFAAASLVATCKSDIQTALAPCGHFALFMGKSTLSQEWPCIARWLAKYRRARWQLAKVEHEDLGSTVEFYAESQGSNHDGLSVLSCSENCAMSAPIGFRRHLACSQSIISSRRLAGEDLHFLERAFAASAAHRAKESATSGRRSL